MCATWLVVALSSCSLTSPSETLLKVTKLFDIMAEDLLMSGWVA